MHGHRVNLHGIIKGTWLMCDEMQYKLVEDQTIRFGGKTKLH